MLPLYSSSFYLPHLHAYCSWIFSNSFRILDAPELLDDYYLNLLSWGKNNLLAIALKNTVYLWNPSDGTHVQ
jgi:cell division cycle protein 20 (cofactor of APC complex)